MLVIKNKLKINRKHFIIIISAIFIFVAISLLMFKYFNLNESVKNDEKNIEVFFENESDEKDINVDENNNEQSTTNIYMAVLEIPEINLIKGLVDKNSEENDVDKNIYVLKESTFPGEAQASHIILASHSGSSEISYFKNLDKLEMKDSIFLYYEGIKYIYEITNIYEIEKTGTVSLRQTEESNITLITCIRGTDKQIVYVGQLVQKEKY